MNKQRKFGEFSSLEKRRFSRKGFEMSIGIIVLLILSILIFSLSIYFLFKWFSGAEQLKAEIDRQTQEQIISALKTGNQLVAIPMAIQSVKRGSPATFGAGVRNIGAQNDFSAAVSFSGAYTPDGREICRYGESCAYHIEENWLGNFRSIQTFNLKKNEEKLLPIMIKADLNIDAGKPTPKGDYTFNVCVYQDRLRSDGTPPAECSAGQFKNDPGHFYTGKIYQVTVKVI